MPLVLIPIITVLVSDFIKALIKAYNSKKFDIRWMFHSGWMPSGHSSFVSSAITVVFLEMWPASIEFMLATVFWILVMYDARWIRRKAGDHAKILNRLQKEDSLDEIIWHSSSEVLAGAIFWILFSFILWKTGYFLSTTF